MNQFQIRKDDFPAQRIVTTATDAGSTAIDDGKILLKVEHFAFTANNITYAAMGDALDYWQFFPALGPDSDGWGVIPVWGFAEIVASKCDALPVGERLFGYFPPADQLTMKPERVSPQRFIDGSAHRAKLPPAYNSYRRISAEANYDPATDNERMLLWPLFLTSYCLWDVLQENNWYQAKQVVVVSASSKTSIGLAYALQDDNSAPTTIGITSKRNINLVKSIGLYDTCLDYDSLQSIDASIPTVIIDMSGNKKILAQLHRHLNGNMKHCINVGLTHWDETQDNDGIIAQRSEFFFAPGHMQARVKEWGAEVFDQKTAQFITTTAAKSRTWLKMKKVSGLDGLSDIYGDVCKGQIAADEGVIVQLGELTRG